MEDPKEYLLEPCDCDPIFCGMYLDKDMYPRAYCVSCNRSWTHYEMTGWSLDHTVQIANNTG